jgi:FG-GAP-like repeat/Bacterial Ig-like domain (group 3)/FG-GAP repeat
MPRFSHVFASGFSLRFASIAVAAAMFAGLLTLPNPASAQGLFQAPTPTLTAGTVPKGVAAADFNRSGWVGMVVANSTSNNIKVFLGTSPNTFNGGTTYPACTNPTAVLAADINHDGYPDIIVACTSTATIDVLFNNRAGGFGTAVPYALSGMPVALVAGDFVGNGYVDVASADSNGHVSVLLNTTGNGTFSASHVTLTGTLSGIAAGDFNKDGKLDLAVSDSANSTVHVLTNDGSGTFAEFGAYSTGAGTTPSSIVAADFNQDGNMDVATSNPGTNTAVILVGNGTGVLTAKTVQAAGTDPIALATTDVNSDGYPDVVAFDKLSASSGAVTVLLGYGDGTLQAPQTINQSFLPGTQAAVADFNLDGSPDLAVTRQNTSQVSVLLNNILETQYPDGRSFVAYNPLSTGMGNFADSIAVGDFNRDGKLDVAVSYLQDNDVQVLFGNGAGSLSAGATYAVGSQPYWVASADLNGDGYPDLVTANTNVNGANGTVSVLLNNKNGTFASAATYNVGKQPYQVAIGDVNGDGYPDLAVTDYGANTVTILMGSKTGTFTVSAATLATCANPYGVAIGDFAHNGYPSVAVTCYTAAQVEVFPNNGNGTFGTPAILTTNVNPASLVVGDFNRDGKLDIVVGNATANNISFFAGNGDNSFTAGVTSPSLNFPDSIVAGDFNGDGILDIAGVAPNFNAVEVTLGVGDGTFGTFAQRAAGQFTAKTQPWALAAGDFNGDGQLDIVTANTFHQVNIASPAYQSRYLGQYPANPSGNPSVDVLINASAATVTLSTSPSSPIPSTNTSVVLQATVQPALSGPTPTGAVLFELETPAGTVYGLGSISGGAASYNVGHLDSGDYQFTSLYNGDSNFQPATAVPVVFTVSDSVPTSGTTCNGTYTGTFHGGITVSPGQDCGFVSGGVNGGITNDGGTVSLTDATVNGGVTNNSGDLTLTGASVNGSVTVNGGVIAIGAGTSIHGNVTISGLSGSSSVCGAAMTGTVTVGPNTAPLVFGNPPSCAGNSIKGGITFNGNSSVAVFANTMSGTLACTGNTSITGGGNTANSKTGQCTTF